MPCKVCRALDIEPFINAIQRILVRKRCGIDQVIICTGKRHAFLLHIVQPHETIVMFRVTLYDLINTELLFVAIQQHIFLFCHVPLLLQICYCNLEGITSALDFLSCRDKNRPRADADKINLLTFVIQPQSLFTVYYCQRKIRARILVLCIIFPLFQQNCIPCVCLNAENAIVLLDFLLAYIITCRAITEQRINPLTQPMPFPCAFFRQRQHIIFSVAIVVHFRKANHPIREIFDFLLCIVHQAVDFFFVVLGQCSRQTAHQFLRCCPVIQLKSKIYDEISLLIIENRFFLLLVGNQLFRILHRGHALCAPFCHRCFQLFQKVGCGQSNRIHRIFQFLHLLVAGPACHIRERVIGRINAQSRADRKCNAFRFGFFRKSVFFLAVLLHEIAVMQHRMSNLVDHRLDCLALAHADLNADFFVCITVIAFGIPFDFIKPHRHGRYLLDCRRKQRIVFDAGGQFVHFQRRNRFPIGL